MGGLHSSYTGWYWVHQRTRRRLDPGLGWCAGVWLGMTVAHSSVQQLWCAVHRNSCIVSYKLNHPARKMASWSKPRMVGTLYQTPLDDSGSGWPAGQPRTGLHRTQRLGPQLQAAGATDSYCGNLYGETLRDSSPESASGRHRQAHRVQCQERPSGNQTSDSTAVKSAVIPSQWLATCLYKHHLQPCCARIHTGVENRDNCASAIIGRVAFQELQRPDLPLWHRSFKKTSDLARDGLLQGVWTCVVVIC